MEPILLLAYWPDRVETYGGRRRELPRLLRRYCRGATRVVIYEARETIGDVRHATRALERWQWAGEYV
jgi:plasmid stabilization system protein ParE